MPVLFFSSVLTLVSTYSNETLVSASKHARCDNPEHHNTNTECRYSVYLQTFRFLTSESKSLCHIIHHNVTSSAKLSLLLFKLLDCSQVNPLHFPLNKSGFLRVKSLVMCFLSKFPLTKLSSFLRSRLLFEFDITISVHCSYNINIKKYT